MLKRIKKNEKGQGLVEYGLILALIAIVSIGALTGLGTKISDAFERINQTINVENEVSDFTYRINPDGKTITVTGFSTLVQDESLVTRPTVVNIPETIKGRPVTQIDDFAFIPYVGELTYPEITDVTLPSGLVHIGDGAFRENNITSLTLPEALIYIDEYAFIGNQLTSLTFPDSVEFIGAGAFYENELTSVTFGSNLEIIDQGAFYENNLTSINIPAKVKKLSVDSFRHNPIAEVTLNSSDIAIFNAFPNHVRDQGYVANATLYAPAASKVMGETSFTFGRLDSLHLDPNDFEYGTAAELATDMMIYRFSTLRWTHFVND